MSLFAQIAGFDEALGTGMTSPTSSLGGLGGPLLGSFLPLIAGLLAVMIIVFIVIYVYLALAFKKIGTKAGLQNPNVSWIFTPLVSVFEISKMHWWPWPVLFIGLLLSQLLIFVSPIAFAIIYALIAIVFTVMCIIWHWKTFEAVGRPGWWILIPVILGIVGILVALASPIAGFIIMIIGFIAYLVLVGLAAWGTGKSKPAPRSKKS